MSLTFLGNRILKETPFITLFKITMVWTQPSCLSTDEERTKMWHIRTVKYYPVLEREEILTYMMLWMNLELCSGKKARHRGQIWHDESLVMHKLVETENKAIRLPGAGGAGKRGIVVQLSLVLDESAVQH